MDPNLRGPWLWPTATSDFFKDSTANVRSRRTRDTWGAAYRGLQRMFPEKRVNEFTEGDLVAFLSSKPWAPNTVKTYRVALTQLFSWAHWKGLAATDPSVGLKRLVRPPAKHVRVGNWLTEEEIGLVLRTVDGPDPRMSRDRLVFLLMFLTGIRVSEMCSLTWSDVRVGSREITVRFGKGGKTRMVGIAPQLEEALVHWHRMYAAGLGRQPSTEPLLVALKPLGFADAFRLDWGRGIAPPGVRGMVRMRGREAGMPGLRPHDGRRTLAAVLKSRGVPTEGIRDALGHEDERTTKAYLEKDPRKGVKVTQDLTLAF